jgi:hypothetical protein
MRTTGSGQQVSLTPTREEREKVRLLSDTVLYERARKFVQSTPAVENKQLNGVIEFSRSLPELMLFVVAQRKRNWTDREANMRRFYETLYEALIRIMQDTRDVWGFVPKGSTEAEAQQRTAVFADMLARNFTQHLVAEMLYVRRQTR